MDSATDDRTPEQRRLAAAQAGDRQAVESLLRELMPRVRNLVRYLVRGDDEVDDMAQQAMVAILRGLPGYRGEGSLRAWADRITARETLAQLRRTRREARRRREAAPELRLVEAPPSPDGYLRRRELAMLLDGLAQEQREALVLHHVMGLSVPEVARALDVPFDTAKSRLRLGTKKLRARARKRGLLDGARAKGEG